MEEIALSDPYGGDLADESDSSADGAGEEAAHDAADDACDPGADSADDSADDAADDAADHGPNFNVHTPVDGDTDEEIVAQRQLDEAPVDTAAEETAVQRQWAEAGTILTELMGQAEALEAAKADDALSSSSAGQAEALEAAKDDDTLSSASAGQAEDLEAAKEDDDGDSTAEAKVSLQ